MVLANKISIMGVIVNLGEKRVLRSTPQSTLDSGAIIFSSISIFTINIVALCYAMQ